jgi:hypothetical protein
MGQLEIQFRELDLKRLLHNLEANGCSRFFAKKLAQNNNSKQQIYLGNGFENRNNAVNLLSYELKEDGGIICLHGDLEFFWMDDAGNLDRAPTAKLIYYQQYPEVRLSGFLQNCTLAPREYLKWEKGMVYPDRILVLGLTEDRKTIAFLAVGPSRLYDQLSSYCSDHPKDKKGVLFEIKTKEKELDVKEKLLWELAHVYEKGWLGSCTLKRDGITDCAGPRCVGLTLEAHLGIVQNSSAEPDYNGWELKALTLPKLTSRLNKVVTIIEPQPTGGLYSDSIRNFFLKFGHADKKDPYRLNFNGRYTSQCFNKELKLELNGFSPPKESFDPAGKLQLVTKTGHIAAEWSFLKLREHWLKKHQSTVFVPALRKKTPLRYRYGSEVLLGEGTSFSHLLKNLASGNVYLDPGSWCSNHGKGSVKHRNMFRIKRFDLPKLYKDSMCVNVLNYK